MTFIIANSQKNNYLRRGYKHMVLVRLGRLSVGKVTEAEFEKICEMGGIKL
ncbi:MAG: hypothetical protein KF900_08595 [Bacteroidetes bacterium]|nr:hypothetical protein [Bacteroidota bacterium]